ncbi:MAG: glucose-1-phosphate adenylyltransferase [bacterium]
MTEVLTFVLAGGQGERLYPLTRDRAKPAVPFAGVYRIIDFTLSNCVNSGLKQVFLLTQYKSYVLEKHVSAGWNIYSAELGEFISLLPPQQRMSKDWYRGTADAVYQNTYVVREMSPEYVLVLSGDHVYRLDYRRMLNYHKRVKADATIGLYEVPIAQASRFGVMVTDAGGRVVGFEEKPRCPKPKPGAPDRALVSMGVYLFTTPALMGSLLVNAEDQASTHDFGRDVIPSMINNYRVFGYRFADEHAAEPYWRDVGTIDEYYRANMELVSPIPPFNLYDRHWPIRTRPRPDPPAKTVHSDLVGGRAGLALDSLLADGVIVSGGRVQQSILGPRVRIHSFAQVEESVLFSDVAVGRHARVRRAIIDKMVRIPDRAEIGFDLEADSKRFHVSPDGIVVIARDSEL